MADRLVYKGDPNQSAGIGFKYELDMSGNRTTITENDGSVTTNVFDNKNRLTRELRTGLDPYVCNYAYDLNDSLISRDLPGGGNVTFYVDIMQKITGGGYSWDTDGRLLSRIGGLGTVTFSYDYADRVSGMTVGSGATALTLAYHYDGDGGLQWLQRNGLRSQFLLDGRDVLREWLPLTITRSTDTVALRPRDLVRLDLNVLSQQVVDYTHGVGLISQRITTLTTDPQTWSTDFFRWDGRATSRRQEDPSKADTNDTIFDAYGLLRSTKTLTSAYGFVGEEGVRQEKGLAPDLVVPHHMRARMYDPLLGRFTSQDPVWDVNLYEYGRDNPWSNIDPGGMQTEGTSPGQVFDRLWGIISREYPDFGQQRQRYIKHLLRDIIHKHGGRWEDVSYGPARELWDILNSEHHQYVLQQRGVAPWHPPQPAWPQEIEV
ncbi:MAG TPA: RHS repeat-associated core domain-containing protein [Armatimonadota bacterium]|nr:RHS repeat-associated core domain-containing protein [Armatimonadota bacterium]